MCSATVWDALRVMRGSLDGGRERRVRYADTWRG